MKHLCKDIKTIYSKVLKTRPSKEDIKGFAELAIILQTCDSGAYTRYARVTETNGAVIGGGNDRFTESFTIVDGKPRLKAFEDGLNL